MKSAGKARNNGLYRHIRTSKEIIRNLLNDYFKLDDQQRVEPNGIALVSHRYCFKIAPTCTAVFLHPMAETILAPHKKREDVCLLNNAHHIFSRMAVPSAGCRTSRSFLLLFTPASVSKHCACFAFP